MSEKLTAIAEGLRAAVGKWKDRTTAAIIVAAGSSTRMGGAIPKQFMPLNGIPAVVRTLRAYEEAEYVSFIVVVARPGDRERYLEYKEKFNLTKLRDIVEGGATRQESVLHGIETIGESAKYVAIADGVRPLITPRAIDTVCLAAYRYGAASAAFRATDTIKTADKHGFVTGTIDRTTVWNATTPQAFDINIYRAAAYHALDTKFVATDDNSLVENIDRPVKLVDCGKENLKLTEPTDVCIAEALLARREKEMMQ